ncbi:MAG: siderophore-interacting protein [Propionicimonas sp.]
MTATTVGFETVPLESGFRPAELVAREWLTPGYLRIRLAGEPLAGFEAPGADDHVRLFFNPAGEPAPIDDAQWRELPSREYTPVAAGEDWVEFDVLIHSGGHGSDWAAHAALGSAVAVAGPRRSNAVTGEPDSLFLAGDESALPAISRFLRQRRPGTKAVVVLEVDEVNRLVPVPADADTELTVLVRPRHDLVHFLADWGEGDRPAGAVLGFVAGEHAVVQVGRALFDRWGLPAESTITKGYWRRG